MRGRSKEHKNTRPIQEGEFALRSDSLEIFQPRERMTAALNKAESKRSTGEIQVIGAHSFYHPFLLSYH